MPSVKGAVHWRRGHIGIGGAHRHLALPGGGVLVGHVSLDARDPSPKGSWEVRQRIGKREAVVAAGEFRGPLRVGCNAADVSMSAILWAARERTAEGGRDV